MTADVQSTMTGHLQAMLTTIHLGALTLAVNPLTWLNELWRDLWVRAAPSPGSGTSPEEIGMWIWWFCVLWFVFLMALMFVFVAKYRRKKGVIAVKSPNHNTPLEI